MPRTEFEIRRAADMYRRAEEYASVIAAAGYLNDSSATTDALRMVRLALQWAAGDSNEFHEAIQRLRIAAEDFRRDDSTL